MFTVNTNVLQSLLTKASNGCGTGSNNINKPIEKMALIQLNNGVLRVTTTNSSQFLMVQEVGINGEDVSFICSSLADLKQLVSKITTENITIDVKDNHYIVKGNGEYTLYIATDEEEGEEIEFPSPDMPSPENMVKRVQVDLDNILSIISSNTAFLADSFVSRAIMVNHYLDIDHAVAGDSAAVCYNHSESFGVNAVVSRQLLELMKLFPKDKGCVAEIYGDFGEKIHISSENIDVYGYLTTDLEEYPIDLLDNFMDTAFEKKCCLSVSEVSSCLGRVNIFAGGVGGEIDPSVYMVFENNGIIFSNQKHTCSEKVHYSMNETSQGGFSAGIQVKLLNKALNSMPEDLFTLYYGNPTCVKFVCGKNVQIIIALQEEDEVGGDM